MADPTGLSLDRKIETQTAEEVVITFLLIGLP
jgi:hypothetical protein